jgi:hypothetical protein
MNNNNDIFPDPAQPVNGFHYNGALNELRSIFNGILLGKFATIGNHPINYPFSNFITSPQGMRWLRRLYTNRMLPNPIHTQMALLNDDLHQYMDLLRENTLREFHQIFTNILRHINNQIPENIINNLFSAFENEYQQPEINEDHFEDIISGLVYNVMYPDQIFHEVESFIIRELYRQNPHLNPRKRRKMNKK